VTVSESGRTWGLRLLALGIAVGIWFNASVEDRLVSSEKTVEATISYTIPRGYVILNPVSAVNVRLMGSKKAIRQLSGGQVDVTVELSQRQLRSSTYHIDTDDVGAPDGLEVVAIEPNSIPTDIEREVTQRLPVVPTITGRPAAGWKAEEAEVFPNQVLVTGPESLFARIDSVATETISLEGRTGTVEEPVAVLSPDPLIQIVQPPRVTVRIPMQPPPESQAAANKPEKEKP
jgi:YbbR domain-containing protein